MVVEFTLKYTWVYGKCLEFILSPRDSSKLKYFVILNLCLETVYFPTEKKKE